MTQLNLSQSVQFSLSNTNSASTANLSTSSTSASEPLVIRGFEQSSNGLYGLSAPMDFNISLREMIASNLQYSNSDGSLQKFSAVKSGNILPQGESQIEFKEKLPEESDLIDLEQISTFSMHDPLIQLKFEVSVLGKPAEVIPTISQQGLLNVFVVEDVDSPTAKASEIDKSQLNKLENIKSELDLLNPKIKTVDEKALNKNLNNELEGTEDELKLKDLFDSKKLVPKGEVSNRIPTELEINKSTQDSEATRQNLLFQLDSLRSSMGLKSLNELTAVSSKKLPELNSVELQSIDSTKAINLNSTLEPGRLPQSSEFQQALNIRHAFTPNLATKVQWMISQAQSSAEILMDPPEMGPLSVKIHHSNGETNIMFQVSNAQTKELLEDNLAKLKEMLLQSGINLGETQVQQQKQQEKSASDQSQHALQQTSGDAIQDPQLKESTNFISNISHNIVDVYS